MWMTRELVTVTPDTPVTEAAVLMSRRRIRRLPVVVQTGDSARLVGVITATDVLHAFPPDVNPFAAVATGAQRTHTLIGELVHGEPVTVAPDAPIEQAAALMSERKLGALPVVRDGRLVGLITESDIFRAFVSLFAAPRGGARLTFDVSKVDDAFGFVAGIAVRHKVRVMSLFTTVQQETPVCVVRVEGAGVDGLLEELWRSGHRVLNVVHLDAERPAERI